jgi:hypothetical protein
MGRKRKLRPNKLLSSHLACKNPPYYALLPKCKYKTLLPYIKFARSVQLEDTMRNTLHARTCTRGRQEEPENDFLW